MNRSSRPPWLKLVVPISAIGIGILGLFDILDPWALFGLLIAAMLFTLYQLRRQYALLQEPAS